MTLLRRAVTLALGLLALVSATARAQTLRLAIVVGNDRGEAARPALHFAETDAVKIAGVLTELGGVAPRDLYLLQGRTGDAVKEAFERAGEKISSLHAQGGRRATLVFYFSGHSDGEALELGDDRIAFTDLRKLLRQSGADVRLAILDSCRSGALLAAKGGLPAAPFEIRLADDSATTGSVMLTASAADEDALESREIRGSFFTHHLVSGLRGAADASGDGRVTLAEAYRYAYDHTLASSSETQAGPQHPAYDMQLSGMGELTLTDLKRADGALLLPAGFERALVSEPWRQVILAEVPAGAARRLAVPPGDYLLRLWRGGLVYVGKAAVGRGEVRTVAWSELAEVAPSSQTASKGAGGDDDIALADLARAQKLESNFDDSHARTLLRSVLERKPSGRTAALAHLYLGLIDLNQYQPDEARREFRLALHANSELELPLSAPPKARLTFAEARREVTKDLQAADRLEASTPLIVPVPAAAQGTVEATVPAAAGGHSHALGITLAALGVVSAGVATYGGLQVLAYQDDLSRMKTSSGTVSSATVVSDRASANTWNVPWILTAIGAAALGVAAGFAW